MVLMEVCRRLQGWRPKPPSLLSSGPTGGPILPGVQLRLNIPSDLGPTTSSHLTSPRLQAPLTCRSLTTSQRSLSGLKILQVQPQTRNNCAARKNLAIFPSLPLLLHY